MNRTSISLPPATQCSMLKKPSVARRRQNPQPSPRLGLGLSIPHVTANPHSFAAPAPIPSLNRRSTRSAPTTTTTTMAVLPLLSQALRPRSLLSLMRTLSLAAAPRLLPAAPTPIRSLSQSALAPRHTCLHGGCCRPRVTVAFPAQQQQQQTRGMKVHSAIRKRCEHCMVGFTLPFERGDVVPDVRTALGRLSAARPTSERLGTDMSFVRRIQGISSARGL
jgi:large subunit ribosomal protein L36